MARSSRDGGRWWSLGMSVTNTPALRSLARGTASASLALGAMLAPAMATVFLARHGQTEWNALGRLQGHTDVPLSDTGIAQARALGEVLARESITVVIASDLSRASTTGAIARTVLGVSEPLVVDADLRERRFGIFEGLTRIEIDRDHREAWQRWQEASVPPPGGEPADEIVARFQRAVDRATAIASRQGPVLVVTHGGIMRVWLGAVAALTTGPIKNGDVFAVSNDRGWVAVPWSERPGA